jgi:hypothetical protein
VVSQLLTLYITPVVYIYMERFQRVLARSRRPRKIKPLPVVAEPQATLRSGD